MTNVSGQTASISVCLDTTTPGVASSVVRTPIARGGSGTGLAIAPQTIARHKREMAPNSTGFRISSGHLEDIRATLPPF